jgi:hypothetical protein
MFSFQCKESECGRLRRRNKKQEMIFSHHYYRTGVLIVFMSSLKQSISKVLMNFQKVAAFGSEIENKK